MSIVKFVLTLLISVMIAMPAAVRAEGNAPQADTIEASIIEENDGTRTLVHEAVIDAPLDRVWESFTTAEGWMDWGPKFARVDLRPGGTIESGYAEDSVAGDPRNIVHRFLAIVPKQSIAMRLQSVPEGGPVDLETLGQTWSVYELEPVDEQRTRIRINGYGYGEGEKFDRVIDFFFAGNKYSIELLRRNIAARIDRLKTTTGGE